MTTITLQGEITETGQLEIDVPQGLQPGPVEVEIRQAEVRQIIGVRLGDLLPLVGLWADRTDITDGVEWELRQQMFTRK